jgi:AcrR family transcriptional regulator
MSGANEQTRRALIRSGEGLFAHAAFGSVTEAEIVTAAGLHDPALISEYFDNKLGLLHAIIDRHQVPVDARRNRLLDDLERRGNSDPREAAEALVFPLSDKLTDPHGGLDYLLILARMRAEPELFQMLTSRPHGITRALMLLIPEGAMDKDSSAVTLMLVSAMVVNGLADCALGPQANHRTFVRVLIDSICAVVGGPVDNVSPLRASAPATAAAITGPPVAVSLAADSATA